MTEKNKKYCLSTLDINQHWQIAQAIQAKFEDPYHRTYTQSRKLDKHWVGVASVLKN